MGFYWRMRRGKGMQEDEAGYRGKKRGCRGEKRVGRGMRGKLGGPAVAAHGRAAASETGLGLAVAPHLVLPLHGRSTMGAGPSLAVGRECSVCDPRSHPCAVLSLCSLTQPPSLCQAAFQGFHHVLWLGELQLAGGPLPNATPQLHGWGSEGTGQGFREPPPRRPPVPGTHCCHPPSPGTPRSCFSAAAGD